jgi:hypothetical protein
MWQNQCGLDSSQAEPNPLTTWCTLPISGGFMRILLLPLWAIPFAGGCDFWVEKVPTGDFANTGDPAKVDILFVFDNSSSMSDEA